MNGIEIHVSEEDFKRRSPGDQSWITFRAIEATMQCVEKIDRDGCTFSHQRYTKQKTIGLKQGLIILGASLGAGLPIGLAIYHFICK